jgi:hypothetical protein
MISIAYVSAASWPMSDEEVSAILVQARANNVRNGLTGALLFHNGRFIQILEGPEEQLDERIRVITKDPRHRNIHIVSREPIEKRQFAEWTMGFRTLSPDAAKQLDGFDDLFARYGKVAIKNADLSAQLFLEWLSEYWFTTA